MRCGPVLTSNNYYYFVWCSGGNTCCSLHLSSVSSCRDGEGGRAARSALSGGQCAGQHGALAGGTRPWRGEDGRITSFHCSNVD